MTKPAPHNNDRAMSRLISLLERRDPEGIRQIKGLYPSCGRAHVIGVTGPPGAGKSCLVSALVQQFRKEHKTVGVLAVDPSSPFTGGAILGDRARMTECATDRGVFIRSFAARGASGGLAPVINDAVDVLDAFGKDVVIVETVGVGQVELDIARIAHTVVLTLVPGYGDSLQAMKAGIMEIGDVLVMNKADQPGAEEAVNNLAAEMPVMVGQKEFPCANIKVQWPVPIVKTSAVAGEGLPELVSVLTGHLGHLNENDLFQAMARKRRTRQFLDILTGQIRESFLGAVETDRELRRWMTRIEESAIDPYTASEQVIGIISQARKIVSEQNNTKLPHPAWEGRATCESDRYQ